MNSGKPIVASFSGYPSMINEAGCGSFVPAGDVAALENEIQWYSEMSPNEREVLGQRGKTWLLKNRRYDQLASEYLEIICLLSRICG